MDRVKIDDLPNRWEARGFLLPEVTDRLAVARPVSRQRAAADVAALLDQLIERDDGRYANTPATDLFLDRAKPSYMGATWRWPTPVSTAFGGL